MFVTLDTAIYVNPVVDTEVIKALTTPFVLVGVSAICDAVGATVNALGYVTVVAGDENRLP